MKKAPIHASSQSVQPRTVVIEPQAGKSWWIMNNHQLHKLSGPATRGLCAAWIETVPPGEGPPPHIHHAEDEIFYVLEGRLTFFANGGEILVGPGALVYSPRGEQHTFRNTGSTTARMLVLVLPAGFENFFAEAAYHSEDRNSRPIPGKADVDRLLSAAARYQLEFKMPSA